jgi:hypothetical protein
LPKMRLRTARRIGSLASRLRVWWNWQTRYFEVVVPQGVQVQVLLRAPIFRRFSLRILLVAKTPRPSDKILCSLRRRQAHRGFDSDTLRNASTRVTAEHLELMPPRQRAGRLLQEHKSRLPLPPALLRRTLHVETNLAAAPAEIADENALRLFLFRQTILARRGNARATRYSFVIAPSGSADSAPRSVAYSEREFCHELGFGGLRRCLFVRCRAQRLDPQGGR